jgi:hypothetical protein
VPKVTCAATFHVWVACCTRTIPNA